MLQNIQYDITIIGGGLAGLSLAIQLAKKNYSVALFEKEQYPFHKVCGEYISLESWNFIESLGLPLAQMQLPIIKKLIVTAPNGNYLQQDLPLGGFGISRFKLDFELKEIAIKVGVTVHEKCKVQDVYFSEEKFTLQTTNGIFESKICIGSFGKRSNLDVKWKRYFLLQQHKNLNNYIGVKYHVKINFAADTIALHNFKDGYCGISKIEKDMYCVCYLTTVANLKKNNNSITEMEKKILYKNPYIKNIFKNAVMVYKKPVTISQISFAKKTLVHNHILLCGDAAGMITPLCGNGMSMALHSSKMTAIVIDDFLQNNISRKELENIYTKNWQHIFGKRIRTGRIIQQLFGKIWVTNLFISLMKRLPFLTGKLIKKTHGQPF